MASFTMSSIDSPPIENKMSPALTSLSHADSTGATYVICTWVGMPRVRHDRNDHLGHIGQPHRSKVKRFRGGLVFKAHRLLYRSTLDLRVIKKQKKVKGVADIHGVPGGHLHPRLLQGPGPLSSEYGTNKTVTARFRSWRSGKSP